MQRAAEKAQVANSGVSTSGPGENERASTTVDIEYQEVKMNGCVAVYMRALFLCSFVQQPDEDTPSVRFCHRSWFDICVPQEQWNAALRDMETPGTATV